MEGTAKQLGAHFVDRAQQVPVREQALLRAQDAIMGDRNNSYGDPIDDFKRTADALTAMGYGKRYRGPDFDNQYIVPLEPHDIAIIQIMVKLSRLAETPTKHDSWVDVAGYAGCGAEVAELE